MKRVTGIGGVFFKAQDQEKLYQWYEKHLGTARAVAKAQRSTGGRLTILNVPG